MFFSLSSTISISLYSLSLADVYDALISERSYKKAFPQKEAEEIIKKESNRIFDPRLVDLFFDNIDKIIEIKET